MTTEERDERIEKALFLLKDVDSVLLDAKMDGNKIHFKWNPVFLHYRDLFIKLGLMEELDEIEFACKILENAEVES